MIHPSIPSIHQSHPFIKSFIYTFILIHSFFHSFMQPFTHSYIHTSIHSSIYQPIHSFPFLSFQCVDVTTQFDRVFWLGDFNFRVELDREQVIEKIEKCKEQEEPDYKVWTLNSRTQGTLVLFSMCKKSYKRQLSVACLFLYFTMEEKFRNNDC